MRSREKEELLKKRGDGLKSVGHWTDLVSTRNNGPAENILERWEAVKFNPWNIFFTASWQKNTQSFLLVEGEKKNHPARSAVDRQSRLSAKCKHIAEKDLLYPAPKVLLASVLISLKQLAFLQSDFSSTTALFFSAVFKDIPELPVLLPVEAK